jgi:hypothetical protein
VERALNKFCDEVPWQEFVNAVDGMIGDAFQNFLQISLGA